jgi:ElaA protein
MSRASHDNPSVRFNVVSFDELTGSMLYEALRLRARVFVVEQTCPYLDCDDRDQAAQHVLGRTEAGALVAYCRLLAPGVLYTEPCIGRVVTAPEVRRQGYGRPLMRFAIEAMAARYRGQGIRISAQRYLEAFYAGLGFVAEGEPYLEDGIPHIEMLRPYT